MNTHIRIPTLASATLNFASQDVARITAAISAGGLRSLDDGSRDEPGDLTADQVEAMNAYYWGGE